MTGEEIIRMLDNPATLGEALTEAEKLPFRGNHRYLFNQKRQKFHTGMSDNEKLNWVGEMKNFLSMYDGLIVATTDGEGFRNYTFDRDNQWHYLDKVNFRERVREICWDRDNAVKAAIPDLQMLNRIISINPSYQFYLIKISITTKKVVIRRD